MTIVEEEHSIKTSGMVETIFHPSTMMTTGDETKLSKEVNVGLTQGGPASPAPYNKTDIVLIRRVLQALRIVDDGDCSVPLKVFADDIALKLTRIVAAAVALRAAGGREVYLPVSFNLERGKSMELVENRTMKRVQRTLGVDSPRDSHADQYLGVGLKAKGATYGLTESRADGDTGTPVTLKPTKALARGTNMTKATEMKNALLESRWT